MSPWIKVLLCLATVAVIAVVEYLVMWRRLKKNGALLFDYEDEECCPTAEPAAPAVEEAVATEAVAEAPAAPAVEEKAEEPVVEEPAAPVVEEKVEEPAVEEVAEPEVEAAEADDTEDVEIGDAQDTDVAKRIAFGEKLLTFNEKVQGYFNTIYNKFISLRKINPRISTKGVSFRLGRDLVARLTIRGKTMRLHLALNVADYDTAIYFQKDMSDVKSYVEIPLMVKIRSDRGMKNAMKLIDALIEAKGIEYKVRYNEVDAIALLKEKVED